MVESRAIDGADPEIRWVPVWVAAKGLKVTVQRVYQLIHSGDVVAMRSGRTWLVAWQSVQGRKAIQREGKVTQHVSR